MESFRVNEPDMEGLQREAATPRIPAWERGVACRLRGENKTSQGLASWLKLQNQLAGELSKDDETGI